MHFQVQLDWDSEPCPLDHGKIFHATKISARPIDHRAISERLFQAIIF